MSDTLKVCPKCHKKKPSKDISWHGGICKECYIKWAQDISLVGADQPRNDALPFTKPAVIDAARLSACEARVETVKQTTTERKL
jgi:hypothetical protein